MRWPNCPELSCTFCFAPIAAIMSEQHVRLLKSGSRSTTAVISAATRRRGDAATRSTCVRATFRNDRRYHCRGAAGQRLVARQEGSIDRRRLGPIVKAGATSGASSFETRCFAALLRMRVRCLRWALQQVARMSVSEIRAFRDRPGNDSRYVRAGGGPCGLQAEAASASARGAG